MKGHPTRLRVHADFTMLATQRWHVLLLVRQLAATQNGERQRVLRKLEDALLRAQASEIMHTIIADEQGAKT